MYFIANHKKALWIGINIFMVASMVIIGGITRLTNSGLSMTEWSLIGGIMPPLNEQSWNILFEKYKVTPEFQFKNYDMTLNQFKKIFFWEYLHRIWGRIIGITFFVPLIFLWINKQFSFTEKRYFALLTLIGCFQGFMGWFMVESGLVDKPDVSHFRLSAHLTTAFLIYILLFFCFWNYLGRQSPFERSVTNQKIKKHSKRIIISIILLIITISSGAFVSGTNAGWAYNNFPLMGDNFFPPVIIEGTNLSMANLFNDIGFIQFFHRVLATLTLITIFITVYKGARDVNLTKLKSYFYFLGIFVICQYTLGVIILKLYVPVALGLFHQLGSLIVLTNLIIIFAEMRNRGTRMRPSVQ